MNKSTGTEVSPDRAAFDKAMRDSVARAEPETKTDAVKQQAKETLASPEKIWHEAKQHKDRFAKKDEPVKVEKEEEPEPVQAKAEEPSEVEAEEEGGDQPDPDLERARTALIRSGFKKKELASMSHKEILSRGLARARALEATDEAWNLAKGAKATSSKAEAGKADTAQSPALPDLKEALGPLAKELLLDERGAAALEEAFKKILTPIVASQASQPAANATADEFTSNLQAARKELEGVFPQLVDPIVFEQVTPIMDTLALLPKYRKFKTAKEAFQAVMHDACVELGFEEDADEAEDRGDEKKTRRQSRSTPNGRARVQSVSPDPDRAAFDYIRAHPGDVKGARRAAGQA